MDNSEYLVRRERVQQIMNDRSVDALFITPGANLFYLTGINAHLSTRLYLLIIPKSGTPKMVLPALERNAAEEHAEGIELLDWTDNDGFKGALTSAISQLGTSPTVALDNQMWATFVLDLQENMPQAKWLKGSEIMKSIRSRKTPVEQELMKKAASISDNALAELLQQRFSGRTERDIYKEIEKLLVKHGHDSMSFCIVGSGPNGAKPHHDYSDRVIQPGDAVVLDFGGSYQGYQSDMTRVVLVKGGEHDEEFQKVYDTVNRARAKGHETARVGVTGEAVDAAVRGVIEQEGYGEYFVHRTGHGLGIDLHEEPYIIKGNTEPLAAGNAFSIEPGIYLPGRFGVRIEDIAIVTEQGEENINLSSHELIYVD